MEDDILERFDPKSGSGRVEPLYHATVRKLVGRREGGRGGGLGLEVGWYSLLFPYTRCGGRGGGL